MQTTPRHWLYSCRHKKSDGQHIVKYVGGGEEQFNTPEGGVVMAYRQWGFPFENWERPCRCTISILHHRLQSTGPCSTLTLLNYALLFCSLLAKISMRKKKNLPNNHFSPRLSLLFLQIFYFCLVLSFSMRIVRVHFIIFFMNQCMCKYKGLAESFGYIQYTPVLHTTYYHYHL